MKSNNYNLSNDILTIKTNFGHYSFKIEDIDLLENAERIVKLMISEMDKVDTKLHSRREKSGQYARLLLANLNICEKYIRLEDKYIALTQELKSIKNEVVEAPVLSEPIILNQLEPTQLLPKEPQLTDQSLASKPKPESATPPVLHDSTVVEAKPIELTPKSEDVILRPESKDVILRPESEDVISQPKSKGVILRPESECVILQPKSEDVILQSESDEIETETEDEVQHLPLNSDTTRYAYKANKSAIANWKLKHSYLSLKRKAMERIMQARIQSQSSDEILERVETLQAIESSQIVQQPALIEKIEPVINHEPTYTIKQPEINDYQYTKIIQQPSLVEKIEPVINHEPTYTIKQPEINDYQYTKIIQQPSLVEKIEPVINHEPTYTIKQPEINDYQFTNKLNIAKPKIYRKGEFQLPNLSFLKNISRKTEVDHHSIRRDAELLEKKLGYFGIKGEVMGVSPGPVITTFEYRPEPGIKISKIVNLADDLALALSAFSIRIVAPIPGKDVMGIEIPNIKKSLVPFIDIVSSEDFMNSKSKLPICLGKDIIGNPVVVELDKMPHLLIAGATGTGKSVGLNAMITSILYKSTPEEVRFLMVDPKRIELSFYNDIPHLLTPVITDMKKATIALQWLVREMDRRYSLLAKSQVRHIEQYNQKIKKSLIGSGDNPLDTEEPEQLPYIVVIIDELADLMMTASRDIEFSLTRLAQMARAAGIHLILATQRPSVDVLTGIIKANFPTRISFQVSSKTDSRTIIDANGAETLLGNGDMLFVPPGTARLTRVHGTYLSEEELMEITTFLKSQGKPEYVLDVITETDEEPTQETMDDDYDDKYNEALEFVVATKQASISGIQRALRVGYNRAARIIDIMEKRGIVGPSDGVKPRRVIVENIEY